MSLCRNSRCGPRFLSMARKSSSSRWVSCGTAAGSCLDRSEADRLHAQAMVNVQHAEILDLRREAVGLRISGPVAFVGGVVIGTGVGIAAAKINAL